MKNIKYILLILGFLFTNLSIGYWLSYPLKQINIGNCERISECWIDLPIIENANYSSYQNNHLYRVVYTMLWWAWYKDWWDLWLWTHLWVDIATIKGTPVYSMLSWEVISAKENWSWGNIVVIKHIWNDEIIFSTYAHLEKFFVKQWDIIKEWDMIALVWDSGNTTWPHLHWQLEKSNVKVHPFYPYGCGDTIENSVNSASCWNQLYKYTLDPIRFIEKNWYDLSFDKQLSENSYINTQDISISTPSLSLWLSGVTNIINFISNTKENSISVLEQPLKIMYDKTKLSMDIDYFYTIEGIKSISAVWTKEWLTQIKIMYWDSLVKSLYYLIIDDKKLNIINKYYDLNNILSRINS